MLQRTSNNFFLLLFCLVTALGCNDRSSLVPIPSFDPEGSAEKAMELFDTNSDGYIDSEELIKSPGLKASMKTLDLDSDSRVSEEEIAERVRTWENLGIGLMSVSCEFYLDRIPLDGASVTFVPEDFLGDTFEVAVGTTDLTGRVKPKIPKERRPSPESPPGIQAGFYRVKVSKVVNGSETIPARYNEETVFGQQISKDDYSIVNKQVIFKLKSK